MPPRLKMPAPGTWAWAVLAVMWQLETVPQVSEMPPPPMPSESASPRVRVTPLIEGDPPVKRATRNLPPASSVTSRQSPVAPSVVLSATPSLSKSQASVTPVAPEGIMGVKVAASESNPS